jgi:transcription elongation factor SPT6
MSVRQLGRTPNPYGATGSSGPVPTTSYGGMGSTPGPGYSTAPRTPYGYQTPSSYSNQPHYPQQPPAMPAGVDSTRATVIQNSGGWGSSGSGWS